MSRSINGGFRPKIGSEIKTSKGPRLVQAVSDELCKNCAVGFYLPSGKCDHCNAAREITELRKENAALRAVGEEIQRHINRALRIGVSTDDQAAMVGAIVDALNVADEPRAGTENKP